MAILVTRAVPDAETVPDAQTRRRRVALGVIKACTAEDDPALNHQHRAQATRRAFGTTVALRVQGHRVLEVLRCEYSSSNVVLQAVRRISGSV